MQAHFHFFQLTDPTKKMQKSLQANTLGRIIIFKTDHVKQESPAGNIGFAKKRASWLFEHSASHQLLWCSCNFEFRNPLLRKAKKR